MGELEGEPAKWPDNAETMTATEFLHWQERQLRKSIERENAERVRHESFRETLGIGSVQVGVEIPVSSYGVANV